MYTPVSQAPTSYMACPLQTNCVICLSNKQQIYWKILSSTSLELDCPAAVKFIYYIWEGHNLKKNIPHFGYDRLEHPPNFESS